MTKKPKSFSIVTLKSGSPPLLVTEQSSGAAFMGDCVEVMWFGGDEIRTAFVHIGCLVEGQS